MGVIMLRKALKKLVGKSQKSKATKKSSSSKSSLRSSQANSPRILTAEGWKRLMMKKYRKSK